jgi:hypothetical protein
LGVRPIPPSDPAWARFALREQTADKRTLIKDETDEALIEIFEYEAHE